jgi:hypothetical protein
MLIQDALSSNFVELAPTRYQFAEVVGDEHDDNWLMIHGHVRLGVDEWSFEDPSLLVVEAKLMASWLRQVGRGQEQASAAADDWPQVSFLEPNLGMALIARESDRVTIRMFFAHESGIPEMATTDVIVDLVVARDDLARAADEWAAALGRFPERTPGSWPRSAE